MSSGTRDSGSIHLGLDVHKDSITAAVLEPGAPAAVMTRMGSDQDAVRRLIDKFARQAAVEGSPAANVNPVGPAS